MSKKMWNRIFKSKSTNKAAGVSKKIPIPTSPNFTSTVENRLSYYEEFHNCCQQQSPVKETSHNPASLGNSTKSQSKFSKVVNTFTLKRICKENQTNKQLKTASTAVDTSHQNGNNYSAAENASDPIMDKIGTPTTAILVQPDCTIEAIEEPISLELIPCPTCNRTFVQETLEKHVRICEKMTVKKRKIFDSSRQRREGTELASYPLPKNYGLPALKPERGLSPKPTQASPPILSPKKPPEEPNKPSPLAKSVTPLTLKKVTTPTHTSTSLLDTSICHSSSSQKERSRTVGIPKRIQPPPAEPCPYCERCFGLKAYDRHVEWCKEKALIASIKQNSTNSQVAAKERLEARIKYRAPCLKTKRSVNRDKYSGQNDENSDMQTSMDENRLNAGIMTSSMTSSFMSDGLNPPTALNPIKPNPTIFLSQFTTQKNTPIAVLTKNIKNSPLQNGKEKTKLIDTTSTSFSMTDGDLEQHFEKKCLVKTLLKRGKMMAVNKAPKIDSKSSVVGIKRKTNEASRTTTNNSSEFKNKSCGNKLHIIKERIQFLSSSNSSTAVAAEQVPGCLPKNKSFIVSGVSDNYDPFLSAKRQLEELCSPTDGILSPFNQAPKTPNTATPSIPKKMTSSLTSTGSLTNPRRVVTTPTSNFRRTSSLRAPRRSPLPVSTRPTFFPTSQKQRPTIQRGLSDEGPISSNFLKPEEYDEMPVRAVCVNDFAITNTPRVIRRDSNSAANRKNLRLNLPLANRNSKDSSPTPPIGTTSNNLLKTDSLAVFLKYENEAKGSQNSVANAKELKDKSNTLSKQNSAKNISQGDDQTTVKCFSDVSQFLVDNSNSNGKMNNIKLEPLVRPVTAQRNSSLFTKSTTSVAGSSNKIKPIKLNSLFDARDRLGEGSDLDFIDPKLINVYDNLPMELGNDFMSNSSSSPSYSGRNPNKCDTEKVGPAEIFSHLSCSSNSSQDPIKLKKDLLASTQTQTTSVVTNSVTNSNRSSSGDNRNQLKRKIRLGLNQFLYDASPENEALNNDADDEGTNISSHENSKRKPAQSTPNFIPPTNTSQVLPNIPPFSPSTFDEFDFEEFLSAFGNDDEQFPSLFKDCREFLMNRTTFNKRSNVEKMPFCRSTNDVPSNSARKYEHDVEQNLNCEEDKNRGEIFISIETDQNESDPHPKNDPLVAANPTAQIEEVNVNDNKFEKIEDDEAGGVVPQVEDEESDDRLRMRRKNLLNDFPNVKINNAKNLIQQMHEDIQDLYTADTLNVEDDLNGNGVRQITGSALYPVDSDEISSIECYPVRGNNNGSSGRGVAVQSKHSADSAYGSLSRQSPIADINTNYRSTYTHRTKTVSKPSESQNQYQTLTAYNYSPSTKEDNQKFRCRNFSAGSSSSGSDNSLPPISGSKIIRQEHQAQLKEFKRSFHRNLLSTPSLENKIQPSLINETACNSSSSNNFDPTAMPSTSTVKTSKFCHECGSRFLLDQAKFCMDCGVRRIVLK